jgi:Protein of unknown function (DUF1631)
MSEKMLQAIVNGDTQQLAKLLALAATNLGLTHEQLRQQLHAKIFNKINSERNLDAQLRQLTTALCEAASKKWLNDDSFYTSQEHPLRQFFNLAIAPTTHWCPRDSKFSQQFFDKFSQLINLTITTWSGATSSFQEDTHLLSQARDFRDWLEAEDRRAYMLETRLCETEVNNLKIISAESLVIDFLNRHLANHMLPNDLHLAFSETLKSELQYWAFNSDADTLLQLPLWKSWQKMLPVLSQVFPSNDNEIDDQWLYKQIPALLAELERTLELPTNNTDNYVKLIDQLSHCLTLCIKKHSFFTSAFTAIPHSSGLNDSLTRIPQALLQQTEKVNQGDWFIIQNEAKEKIRCKLALKNPRIDQLLFVDQNGRKVMNKSNKDFAVCLSTGIAAPLPPLDINQLILNELTAFINNKEFKNAETIPQLTDTLAAETEKEKEARTAAAQKAKKEAQELLEHSRKTDISNPVNENQETEKNALETVNSLRVGAWFEINEKSDNQKKQRAKLSVIINAADKFIFADQSGKKLAEYSRVQLVELIDKEQATVIRNGDDFADQLEKVIRTQRRDIK